MAEASQPCRATPPGKSRESAFSLTEVVIAIGIISFVLMAIIGLFFMGLQTARESAEDTNLALMTQQINAWSRTQTFTNLTASNRTFFFDAMGEWNRNPNGDPAATPPPNSHYACTVSASATSVSTNFTYLQYRFEWPLAAPISKRQQRVVIASRANEN